MPKCVICAGAHSSKEYSNKTQVRCCNCGGQHTASYAGCQKMKAAAEVPKIKANEDITQNEAEKQKQQTGSADCSWWCIWECTGCMAEATQ